MTDYLNNSNKTTLLFKKFQNKTQAAIDVTTNGTGGTSFFNEQKKSLNNIYNTDIFIENIERNLSDEYKLSSLDACGNIPGSVWNTSISDQDYSNSSFSIPNTNLIFYKEIYLNPVSGTNNAWWLIPPEFSDQITDNNLLKDMIPFNFNSISLSTFSPIVKYWNGSQWRTQSQNNVSGLNWLIDYASGILQFYQNDSILNSLNIDCNSIDEKKRPRISFIKYAGAKGLENFSSGNISANNLFINLTKVISYNGLTQLYDYTYNDGEINFVGNDENISKIKSTYDGSGSSINFSVLNNNILADRVTINKEGIDINGNLSGTSASLKENVTAQWFNGNLSGTNATLTDNVRAPIFNGNLSGTNVILKENVTAQWFNGNLSGTNAYLSNNITAQWFNGNLSGTNASLTENVIAQWFNGNLSGKNATLTENVTAQWFNGNLSGTNAYISGNISANNLFTNTINRNNIENLYNFTSNYDKSYNDSYNIIDDIYSTYISYFTNYYLSNSTNSGSQTGIMEITNNNRNYKVIANGMVRKFGDFALNDFLNLFIQFKVINNSEINFGLNNNNGNSSIYLVYLPSSNSFYIKDSIGLQTIPITFNVNDIIILWYSVNINKLLVIKLNTSSFSIIYESDSWNYLSSNNDIYFTFTGNVYTEIHNLYFNVYSPYSSHPDLLKEKIFNDYDKFLNIYNNPLEIYDKSNYKNLAIDYDDFTSQDMQISSEYPINSNNYTNYSYTKTNGLNQSGIINFYNNNINTKFTDNFYFQCQIDNLSSNFVSISLFDENDSSYYLHIDFNLYTGTSTYVPSTGYTLGGPNNSYTGISLFDVNITNNMVIILFYDGNIFSFYTIDSNGLNVIIKDHYYFKLANRKIHFRIASSNSFDAKNIYVNDYCPYANNIDDFEKGNFSYYKNFLEVNAPLQLTKDILINGNIIINTNVNISNFNNDSGYIQQNDNISLLINDSGYVRAIDSNNINSNCNRAKYISYNADHNSHYMSLGYTSVTNRFQLNMEDGRDIETDYSRFSGYADYTHKLNNNINSSYLYMSRLSNSYDSVALTHNSTSNWGQSGTAQILFYSNNVYLRNSGGREFAVADHFYMWNLQEEGSGTDNQGQAYVVYNIHNSRLFYYYTGSDDRRKHNEVKINNALETIMKLEGLRYDMTNTMYALDYSGEITENYKKEAGFIAQSVLKIDELKFTVTGGDYLDNSNNLIENSYQLNYNAIFTYSVVAIQELKRICDNKDIKIEEQKNEIDSLKEKNLDLENKVDILKNKLNELLSESGKETINF